MLHPVTTREVALAIVPKVTGGLSMVGSALLAFNVCRYPHKRKQTYHRLLLTMSLCDFVTSSGYVVSTWPIPPGTNNAWEEPYYYGAVGNTPWCVAQGVAIQWGIATALLNTALAVHYLLVVRYNYRERHLKKLEPYLLGLALTAGAGLTIPGIFLNIYQPGHLWCWISPNFTICEQMGINVETDCVHRAYRKRWIFYFVPVWICISTITVLQVMLFAAVRKLERRASRWRSTDPVARQYRQSRQVAKQAACYVSVFYLTWLPYTGLVATGRLFKPYCDLDFAVLLLVVLFSPLQGVLNFLVYRHEFGIPSVSRSMVAASLVISQIIGRRVTPRRSGGKKSKPKLSAEGNDMSGASKGDKCTTTDERTIPELDGSGSNDTCKIDNTHQDELQEVGETSVQQDVANNLPGPVVMGVDVGDDGSVEYRDEISDVYGT